MPGPFHDVVEALSRPPVRTPQSEMGWRTASLAVVVLPNRDLLFMKRATVDRDPWSGHMSFPGGKMEPSDKSSEAAAIREAHEEMGIELSSAQALGEMDEIATLNGLPSMVIRPHVFGVPTEPILQTNIEVASVHRMGLAALLDGTGRSSFELNWKDRKHTMACVDVDGHRLWGLTLMVVDDLLNRIDGRGIGLDRPTR